MSSKYQKSYNLPPSFPDVLKNFTREVLRDQPANIYEFASKYFTQLADQEAASQEGGAESADQAGSSQEGGADIVGELAGYLVSILREEDPEQTGVTSVGRLREILEGSGLGLGAEHVAYIFGHPSVNIVEEDDAPISYDATILAVATVVAELRAQQAAVADFVVELRAQ